MEKADEEGLSCFPHKGCCKIVERMYAITVCVKWHSHELI